MELYLKAKNKRPGKDESDYLKLIALTKPPLDYQRDGVIDKIISEYNSIDELAEYISEIKSSDFLWQSRRRNLIDNRAELQMRNKIFFRKFWQDI